MVARVAPRVEDEAARLRRRMLRLFELGELVALPDPNEDRERRSRGVSLRAWLVAPEPPSSRAECEDGPRPCPALRCEYNLGRVGEHAGYTCWLDVAELPADERTLDLVGALVAIKKSKASQDVTSAFTKIEKSDPETLRLLGVRRRHT